MTTDIIKRNKIRILRETADTIEQHPHRFNWDHPNTCTMGILASVAVNQKQPFERWFLTRACWSDAYYCHQTGLVLSDVISQLEQLGFAAEDIDRAEYGSPTIKKAWKNSFRTDDGEEVWDFEKPDWVVANLRRWADELEQELLFSVRQPQSQPVVVRQML